MSITEQQKMIRDTARKIAQDELAPRAAEIDRSGAFPREGLSKLAEAGFMGMTLPPPLGGTGADTLSFVLAMEEIARGCSSTALLVATHSIVTRALLVAGSDEQKGRFLPEMAAGRKLGALAATEAVCGANPVFVSTKAATDGDDLVVNGSKIFITGAGEADNYLVVLKTDRSQAPPDLTAVVIEKGTPGFTFGNKEDTMGLRGTSDGELLFENCRVPRANMLGPENGYLTIMPPFIGMALMGAAGMALGIAQAAVDAAAEHGKTRQVGGQPIGNHQGVQYLVADTATSLAAARELTYSAARMMDGPPPPSPLPIYMSKLYATEMAVDVTHKALQVHGGNGYSRELPLERLYRDARGLTLHFSPTEMLKGMLGRMLMGMPPM